MLTTRKLVKVKLLRNKAYGSAACTEVLLDIMSKNSSFTRCSVGQTRENTNGGRFTRPIGAKQAKKLAGLNL